MLGQLLGYDSKAERLAVLDAGLTVRGVEFAGDVQARIREHGEDSDDLWVSEGQRCGTYDQWIVSSQHQ